MVILAPILTSVQPTAIHVVKIKNACIRLAHTTVSINPDILLIKISVSISTNVKISLAISMKSVPIPMAVFHVVVLVDLEAME